MEGKKEGRTETMRQTVAHRYAAWSGTDKKEQS